MVEGQCDISNTDKFYLNRSLYKETFLSTMTQSNFSVLLRLVGPPVDEWTDAN